MSSMDDLSRLPDDSQGGRVMAEQRKVADRLWAYSDAVFAVIVTVMVLQLRTPTSHHFSSLLGLWPTLISYVASYVFIAIIWINYHYLSRFVETPSLGLVWINFLHLLFVSLIPFTTAWMARTRLASDPVIVYTALFVCAAGVFNVLEYQVFKQTSLISRTSRQTARRRSLLALLLFGLAILAAAAFKPWLGFVLVCSALVLHIKPDIGSGRVSAIDRASDS
jgi:uncharacterized membrane protein